MIYGIRQGTRYKIVSKKNSAELGEKIQTGGHYNFDLWGLFSKEMIMPGREYCVDFDKMTKICSEDSVYYIVTAKNINGIKFKKK